MLEKRDVVRMKLLSTLKSCVFIGRLQGNVYKPKPIILALTSHNDSVE